jgi:predicted NUDIX family NTP pyrophosphohydrolase
MKKSAGILLYRKITGVPEVLLVHPGGPLWKNRDTGAWTIPKGEFDVEEDALAAANREFTEETGIALYGDFMKLTPIRQKAGKWVHAWALEGDLNPAEVQSNVFEMEWPPKSGTLQRFPEMDRAAWFSMTEAREKILPGQVPLLEELSGKIKGEE